MKDNEIIVPELNDDFIKSKIYEIRGQKVMLDFELAEIYGYSTKAFNQQVQRNIAKFPLRYRFQLTKEELQNLARSQIVTARIWTVGNTGGRTNLPYAFTKPGIQTLMTIMNGDLATKQSIALDMIIQLYGKKELLVKSSLLYSLIMNYRAFQIASVFESSWQSSSV